MMILINTFLFSRHRRRARAPEMGHRRHSGLPGSRATHRPPRHLCIDATPVHHLHALPPLPHRPGAHRQHGLFAGLDLRSVGREGRDAEGVLPDGQVPIATQKPEGTPGKAEGNAPGKSEGAATRRSESTPGKANGTEHRKPERTAAGKAE